MVPDVPDDSGPRAQFLSLNIADSISEAVLPRWRVSRHPIAYFRQGGVNHGANER